MYVIYFQNLRMLHQHLRSRNADFIEAQVTIIVGIHAKFRTDFSNNNTWIEWNISFII